MRDSDTILLEGSYLNIKKAEAQAKAYVAQNPVIMPTEWEQEYSEARKELENLRRKWDSIRDRNCPAGKDNMSKKCICTTLPEYPIYLSKTQPLTDKINRMFNEKHRKGEEIYRDKLTSILSGMKAKGNYIKPT